MVSFFFAGFVFTVYVLVGVVAHRDIKESVGLGVFADFFEMAAIGTQ